MDILNHIDRNPYLEVARKQSQLWGEIFGALFGAWRTSIDGEWDLHPDITRQDVMEDLAHGRD